MIQSTLIRHMPASLLITAGYWAGLWLGSHVRITAGSHYVLLTWF